MSITPSVFHRGTIENTAIGTPSGHHNRVTTIAHHQDTTIGTPPRLHTIGTPPLGHHWCTMWTPSGHPDGTEVTPVGINQGTLATPCGTPCGQINATAAHRITVTSHTHGHIIPLNTIASCNLHPPRELHPHSHIASLSRPQSHQHHRH